MDRLQAVRPYWDSFWAGDLPALCVVVPKDPANPVAKPPLGITRKTDIDALCDQLLAWEQNNHFLGGAIPFYCVYLFDAYNILGLFLGGQVEGVGDSYHMIPFVDDLDSAEIHFDPDAEVAHRLRKIVDQIRDRVGEKILISGQSISANLDTLEAIRGSERLLVDLIDNPAGVHRCLDLVDQAAAEELAFFAELYDYETYGCIARHGMYHRGLVSVPQCDFGYMIGPDHFREFAYPYLSREFARLDGVCYHLDGVGNLPNLELLCSDENLHIIQWVAGAGQEGKDWSWLIPKIDQLGKGQLLGGTMERFDHMVESRQSPWLYWMGRSESVEEVNARLKDIGAPV